MYHIHNLDELSKNLDRNKKFLLTVTFHDEKERKIYTSAFTHNFPISDIPVALKDINKSVNSIEEKEVKRSRDPESAQEDTIKKAVS